MDNYDINLYYLNWLNLRDGCNRIEDVAQEIGLSDDEKFVLVGTMHQEMSDLEDVIIATLKSRMSGVVEHVVPDIDGNEEIL